MIPLSVLESSELQSLHGSEYRVLICLAGQFFGYNNGHLTFTEKDGERFGIRKQTRSFALRKLEQAGLIVKTQQGGINPFGPTRWALSWIDLNYRNGKWFTPSRRVQMWINEKWAMENKLTGAIRVPSTGASSAPGKAESQVQ